MNDKSKRLNYVDIVKGIAIIMVIYGHVSNVLETDKYYSMISHCIGAFHMPLFFISYGIVCMPERILNEKDFYFRRFLTLIVPYVIWCLIYSSNIYSSNFWWGLIYGTNPVLSEPILWFYTTMFIAVCIHYFVSYCWRKIGKNVDNETTLFSNGIFFLAMGFLLSYYVVNIEIGLPWGINNALVGVGFIFLGNVFFLWYEKNRIRVTYIYLGILIFGIWLTQYTTRSAMALSIYTNPIIFTIESTMICFSLFGLARYFDSHFLRFLGQNTSFVFASHSLVLQIVVKITQPILEVFGLNWIKVISVLVLTILIECLGILICNRYCPILGGKYKYQKSM